MSVTALLCWLYPSFDRGGWRDVPGTKDHNLGLFGVWLKMMAGAWPAITPFYWGYSYPPGFTHGWTLQMEYRGSIVVYVLCLITSQMAPWLRRSILVFTAWLAVRWGRWEVLCFVEGMMMADIRIAPLT